MSNVFFTYYAALVIFVSIAAVALANSNIGGWILRLAAIGTIVMSAFVLQKSYDAPKDFQYYFNEGRAALKEHL